MRQKTAGVVVAMTLMAIVAISAEAADTLVYRAVGTEVTEVKPVKAGPPELPDSLIIPPGEYSFGGNIYRLDEPGLYRFVRVGRENAQRIVNTGDVQALMSAFAWLHVHGTADEGLNLRDLERVAQDRKISVTCGLVASLVKDLLAREGIAVREVGTVSAGPYNEYDNGHALIEVYRRDLHKWVVYDIDNNVYYMAGGVPLSVYELVEHVQTNDYSIVRISWDMRAVQMPRDGSFDYTFYAEFNAGTPEALRQWLSRVARVAVIRDGDHFYFSDAKLRSTIEDYSTTYQYLSATDFMNRFYAAPPAVAAAR